MRLSERMKAVASMVTNGNRVADVGTDHGYIPIMLVKKGFIPCAVAMDINEGPLQRARENIREHQLQEKIVTRLSDGLKALNRGEADTIVIAGMGGDLVIRILAEGENICRSVGELILQPQSEIQKVRKYLREQSYHIVDENMIYEDGKYYCVMKAVLVEESNIGDKLAEMETVICDRYGPLLLKNGSPVLRSFLVKEHKKLTEIEQNLKVQKASESVLLRLEEVKYQIECNETAYAILGVMKDAGI